MRELSMAIGALAFTVLNNLIGRFHIFSLIEDCSTSVAMNLQWHGQLTDRA
jgi:hypothetical protein